MAGPAQSATLHIFSLTIAVGLEGQDVEHGAHRIGQRGEAPRLNVHRRHDEGSSELLGLGHGGIGVGHGEVHAPQRKASRRGMSGILGIMPPMDVPPSFHSV